MTDFYNKLAATAERLLERYGRELVVVSPSVAGDPVTGAGASSGSQFVVRGLLIPYSQSMIDGTRITAQDRLLFLPHTFTGFTAAHRVRVGATGKDWVPVEDPVEMDPGGTNLLTRVQVRQ